MQQDFHVLGGSAADIPIDQGGGIDTSVKGSLPNLEPASVNGPMPNSPLPTGQGPALPTNFQGKLDLPFSQGAGGKGGFTGGVDVVGRGAGQTYQQQGKGSYQPQGSVNFTQGSAAAFTVQQGALNGVGKTGGFVPFNPGALGNFTATPTSGGAAGAASSIGGFNGGAAAIGKSAGIGVTIGGAAGAHAAGRNLAPSLVPGTLIMPQR